MNLVELKRRLESEGYGPLIDASADRLLMIEGLRIWKGWWWWRVCDIGIHDRGEIDHTHVKTGDESQACACFYEQIARRGFLAASFNDRESADRLAQALTEAGIEHHRDYFPDHQRFRLIVAGGDLGRARELAQRLAP